MGHNPSHLCGVQVVVITQTLHSLLVVAVVFTLHSSMPSSQTSTTQQNANLFVSIAFRLTIKPFVLRANPLSSRFPDEAFS